MRFATTLPVTVTVLAALALGCQQQPAAVVDAPGERVENPELALAIAALPQPFEEVAADGSAWTFEAPGDGGAGTLVISVGPAGASNINLVDEVKARKAAFESTEGATYFGNRELGGPFGTIYTARGSLETPDGPVEETWAYAIHPSEYRLLTIRYTYPTGESGTRVEQLMVLLGEIEGLGDASGG